jgi:glycosyltransferase involved in cell wall biosynthesis
MMRILHVTPYFEGAWAYGGIPRAAAATVRGLARRGHRLTVCTTDASLPHARLDDVGRRQPADEPVDVRVFPNLSNTAAYHLQFFTPVGLRPFMRAQARAFDVAHLHGCHHLPGAIASRWLRKHGIPYVLTPHGTAPYLEGRRLVKRLFDATLDRGTLAGASRVIAVSDAEQAQLLRHGVPASAVCVVPNPVDVSSAGAGDAEAVRRSLGIPADASIVLFLGRLSAQKRLDVLVAAFATLERTDSYLVLAGNDVGYGDSLNQMIEQFGVRTRTRLPGLIQGAGRFALLNAASVVAYASEQEAFGLVPLEALASGTPVVVSDDSGCSRMIRECAGGIAVPSGQPGALRDALRTILSDQLLWRANARAAGDCVRRRYDSDVVCNALEDVYRRARLEHSLRRRR